MKNLAKKTVEDIASKPISRKEAIKKTGYIALSAATMMILLSGPAQAGGREDQERGREDRERGRDQNQDRHRHSGPSTSHCTN